eukprot:scaffold19121_cov66-Cyclotella_meneghiniana.AAC.1
MLRWSTRDASRYLCVFVVGCDGLLLVAGATDDGSVEQQSGIIGSDAHRQVADEIGDVVIRVFSAVGLLL